MCPKVSTEALQVLVMPFYQILVSSDDSRLFSKVIGGIVKRILNALIPPEDGAMPQLTNVDMRPLLKDMFLIAASPCVAVNVMYASGCHSNVRV